MWGTKLITPSLYLEQEVRTDEQEGQLTSRRRWRCGTTRACCTGWRSPTLDRSGFAGPNIFVSSYQGLLSVANRVNVREFGTCELRRTHLAGTRVTRDKKSKDNIVQNSLALLGCRL